MELEIWRDILQLHSYAQILRTCMKNRKKVCCAMHTYDLVFLKLYDSMFESLVVGIYRLTEPKRGRVTYPQWINVKMSEAKDESSRNKVKMGSKALFSFMQSDDYKIFLQIRHECYAHRNAKIDPLKLMQQKKWHDLFSVIDHLRNIFNLLADASLQESTLVATPRGAKYLQEETMDFLMALEKTAHNDSLHKRMLARG